MSVAKESERNERRIHLSLFSTRLPYCSVTIRGDHQCQPETASPRSSPGRDVSSSLQKRLLPSEWFSSEAALYRWQLGQSLSHIKSIWILANNLNASFFPNLFRSLRNIWTILRISYFVLLRLLFAPNSTDITIAHRSFREIMTTFEYPMKIRCFCRSMWTEAIVRRWSSLFTTITSVAHLASFRLQLVLIKCKLAQLNDIQPLKCFSDGISDIQSNLQQNDEFRFLLPSQRQSQF